MWELLEIISLETIDEVINSFLSLSIGEKMRAKKQLVSLHNKYREEDGWEGVLLRRVDRLQLPVSL
jgi:hypothetical protein